MLASISFDKDDEDNSFEGYSDETQDDYNDEIYGEDYGYEGDEMEDIKDALKAMNMTDEEIEKIKDLYGDEDFDLETFKKATNLTEDQIGQIEDWYGEEYGYYGESIAGYGEDNGK